MGLTEYQTIGAGNQPEINNVSMVRSLKEFENVGMYNPEGIN
jgi:hypothetical protein